MAFLAGCLVTFGVPLGPGERWRPIEGRGPFDYGKIDYHIHDQIRAFEDNRAPDHLVRITLELSEVGGPTPEWLGQTDFVVAGIGPSGVCIPRQHSYCPVLQDGQVISMGGHLPVSTLATLSFHPDVLFIWQGTSFPGLSPALQELVSAIEVGLEPEPAYGGFLNPELSTGHYALLLTADIQLVICSNYYGKKKKRSSSARFGQPWRGRQLLAK